MKENIHIHGFKCILTDIHVPSNIIDLKYENFYKNDTDDKWINNTNGSKINNFEEIINIIKEFEKNLPFTHPFIKCVYKIVDSPEINNGIVWNIYNTGFSVVSPYIIDIYPSNLHNEYLYGMELSKKTYDEIEDDLIIDRYLAKEIIKERNIEMYTYIYNLEMYESIPIRKNIYRGDTYCELNIDHRIIPKEKIIIPGFTCYLNKIRFKKEDNNAYHFFYLGSDGWYDKDSSKIDFNVVIYHLHKSYEKLGVSETELMCLYIFQNNIFTLIEPDIFLFEDKIMYKLYKLAFEKRNETTVKNYGNWDSLLVA